MESEARCVPPLLLPPRVVPMWHVLFLLAAAAVRLGREEGAANWRGRK